jgi:hypothetical protein
MSMSTCFRNFAEVKTNSEKIPTTVEFQKSTSVDTLLQTKNGTNGKRNKWKIETSVCWL